MSLAEINNISLIDRKRTGELNLTIGSAVTAAGAGPDTFRTPAFFQLGNDPMDIVQGHACHFCQLR